MVTVKRRVLAGMAALAAGGVLVTGHAMHHDCTTTGLADRRCTPGAFDPSITKVQVCNGEAAGRPRRVSDSMRDEAIRKYGLDPDSFHGEVDHLVSRELGGTDVPANLWPESGPIPNSKDAVENSLRRQVCAGTLTLRQAQQQLVGAWSR